MIDAESLFNTQRLANAGQLYGFVVECGLKAVLIACGVQADADGGIPADHPTNPSKPHPMRQHVPNLIGRITNNMQMVTDGARMTRYLAMLQNLSKFRDWSIDHRYWSDAALPLGSVPNWRTAAGEVGQMLDQAKQDGVL